MPSCVMAASPHQIDDLAASPVLDDQKNLSPPVLQEVEVIYASEHSLDSQGHKHLDQSSSVENYTFGVQEDVASSYQSHFPMPGLASADMLRDFIRHHLQPFQIVNEYGVECDISNVSNYHLPVLQAKMWTQTSNNHTAEETAAQRPSSAQIRLAGHISRISGLLEEGHIFVFSENAKNESCNYLSDRKEARHTCNSRIVRIEPLVHWGTLTPANPLHCFLPFRRDGELVRKPVEHPGYTQLVKRLTVDAPVYCIDCLTHLWDQRAEAREITRQILGAVIRPRSKRPEDKIPRRHVVKAEKIEWRPRGPKALAAGGATDATATNTIPAAGWRREYFGASLPQLDGSFDRPEEAHMGQSSGDHRDSNALSASPENGQPVGDGIARMERLHRVEPLTVPLHLAALTVESSSGDATSVLPPTAASKSTSKENQVHGSNVSNSDCYTPLMDLTTPSRAEERKFGRELDSNAKALLVHKRRSPRNHKAKMVMSHNTHPVPIKPMQALVPVEKTRAAPKKAKETRKRKITHVGEQTGKQENAQVITPGGFMPLSMNTGRRDPTVLPNQPQPACTVRLQRASKSGSTIRSRSPPKLVVHFTKRPAESDIPDGVAEEEWEAFRRTCPASTSRICWCNKPASHSASKKKDHPQVAQCSNKNCRVRWLHYSCLNLSEKAKARFGTLLCSVCCVEQEMADRNRKSGWTVGKSMNFQPVYTKQDIQADMPGLGGVMPRPNAYGLGLETELGPKYGNSLKETGTLGGLDVLGYTCSRPEMLEEAYMHAGAYAELLAKRAKEDEDAECEEKLHVGEEGYDEDEEVGTE